MSGILERVQILHEVEWLEERIGATRKCIAFSRTTGAVIDKRPLVYQDLLDRLILAYPEVAQIKQQLKEANHV